MTDQQMALLLDYGEPTPRALLVDRWNMLVCIILPGMAKANYWPISLDHCFMRVCLDTAMGKPWHLAVNRPAVRHLTDDQLRCAVVIAEGMASKPDILPALNHQSIAWRKAIRSHVQANKR